MASSAPVNRAPARFPDLVPDYRVRAKNLSRYSANRIHDDAEARRFGYAGGLVSGVTVYAYMTYPLVATWGLDWLRRGTVHVRFLRPVYDGEAVCVSTRVVGRSGGPAAGETAVEVSALGSRGEPAATAAAGLAWGALPIRPNPHAYPPAPLPPVRPTAAADVLSRLGPLGSPILVLGREELARYVDEVEDPLVLYRGADAAAHPGLLLQQANRALSENVELGPWIHVASDAAHCGLARVGDRLTARGRVARVFERKAHHYVELDVLVVANDARPVLHVRHTAIYRLREPGEDAEISHA